MITLRHLFTPKAISLGKQALKNRLVVNIAQKYSTKARKEDPPIDEGPIKYSTSGASRWSAQKSRMGSQQPRLWYEPHVLIASFGIFLIYFCILREENDIDLELGRTLYSRIEGLEESQLRISLHYNEKNGLDTAAIIQRLKEIEAEKTQN